MKTAAAEQGASEAMRVRSGAGVGSPHTDMGAGHLEALRVRARCGDIALLEAGMAISNSSAE